jgi:hypothetical protein
MKDGPENVVSSSAAGNKNNIISALAKADSKITGTPEPNLNDLPDVEEAAIETEITHSLDATPTSLHNGVLKFSSTEFAQDIWLFNVSIPKRSICLQGFYRQGLIDLLHKSGFAKRLRGNGTYFFIRDVDNIIETVEPHQIQAFVSQWVKDIAKTITFKVADITAKITAEKFIEIFLRQAHLVFCDSFLINLPTHTKPFLRDEAKVGRFFFQNGVAVITLQGVCLDAYDTLSEGCIWRSQIIDHKLTLSDDADASHFAHFILNVAPTEERYQALCSGIGYLLHDFFSPLQTKAVILYDEKITSLDEPQGGTGKGLIAHAVGKMRQVDKIDGKKFDGANRFCFQNIKESTQVMWLDETNPNLEIDRFNTLLTDGFEIERKNRDSVPVKPEDSPKLLICSNGILAYNGTTRIRRQFIVELSDHYSSKIIKGTEEPVRQEHGCTFFSSDWPQEEWNKFYCLMLGCLRFYLNNGLKPYELVNVSANRLRQTTGEDFAEWATKQAFCQNQRFETKKYFTDFQQTYFPDDDGYKQRGFTNSLKKYALTKKWKLEITASNGVSQFQFG